MAEKGRRERTKGEPLLEIETDKAVVEIEAPGDGVLAGVTAEVGAVIPVGRNDCVARRTWRAAPGRGSRSGGASIERTCTISCLRQRLPRRRRPSLQWRLRFHQRRAASLKNSAWTSARVRGTGPERNDHRQKTCRRSPMQGASPVPEAETPSQVARLMAERTTQSWTTVPHFFVVRDVDATALLAAQERLGPQIEKAHSVRATITDLLIALVARVLTEAPAHYSSWAGDRVRPNKDVNISVAMAVKDGVVGAVIPDADAAAPGAISAQRRDLTERARAGRLRPTDIANATFTISNLGMYKVDAFTAIIVPPQAAILAVGGISDRVVPVEGKPGIRPMMTLTLSSDHRVVDGAGAAAFLNDVIDAVSEPEKWLS